MSLADRCRTSFPHTIQQLGAEAFRQGLIKLNAWDDEQLEAEYHNRYVPSYKIRIDWSAAGWQEVAVFCNCPGFEKGFFCKHLWAAMLAADARGLTKQVPRGGQLEVVIDDEYEDELVDLQDDFDDPLEFEDEGFEDEGFAGEDGVTERAAESPTNSQPVITRRTLPAPYRNGESRPLDWKQQLHLIDSPQPNAPPLLGPWDQLVGKMREVWYVLDVGASQRQENLQIELFQRERKQDGQFGKVKRLSLARHEIEQFTDPEDRALLQLLLGSEAREEMPYRSYPYRYSADYSYGQPKFSRSVVTPPLYDVLLPRLCATGRCLWLLDSSLPTEEGRPVIWEEGEPWRLRLHVTAHEDEQLWRIQGQLGRQQERVALSEPVLLLPEGIALFPDRLAKVVADPSWLRLLRRLETVEVPYGDRQQLLEHLWRMPGLPELELPENLRWEQVRQSPQGRLAVLSSNKSRHPHLLLATVSFVYGEHAVAARSKQSGLVDQEQQRVVLRDPEQEGQLLAQLSALGVRGAERHYAQQADVQFPKQQLQELVDQLLAAGWVVEAEGGVIRRPGHFHMSVHSDVDWFDLEAQCDFDGVAASLPDLLAALRNGERFVELGDGSRGMLPEQWLSRYGALADLGEVHGETLRFSSCQALLLDALLAAQENVDVDGKFHRIRRKLRSFSGVQARRQPRSFSGQLREYQQDGLGWLHFLKDFGFGGCLADDMGLGKTIQVLALLEARRVRRMPDGQPREPSLVVVPRSLIFNWMDEASRFTPKLKVLNYTGTDRQQVLEQLDQCDVMLTTYGTLRRDIAKLKDVRFDYAILDEAQAVKNANSQAAKACRLIQAQHRLAMTGTPVENHLGELWSLFEFLNPGMLGRMSAFQTLSKNGNGEDSESLTLLAQALRPFILRRTKGQVLTELPEKTEQTLYCEMDPKQRRLYNDLRDYYRASLSKRLEQDGLQKSKIHVLEALLRLRQVACHPGLMDKSKSDQPSAKLETLLEQIQEVVQEGHKALVFSQFTSLLAIVRKRLDQQQITYEYLDGRTRKRGDKVKRFQDDPSCPLFLISMKAGGHGLNLTAADYVFILDPWWNPAVESQAVDRAHRLGQDRHVFAYRLICRDTVEEKILQLQESKRNLAEAIISADNSLIRSLTADDLQLLLS